MLDNKQFKDKLNGVITSAKNQRQSVQALIESGLEQYRDFGNAGQLSLLMDKCVGVKSMPTVTIKNYIKAQANVKYSKNVDGNYVFSKASKEEEVSVTLLSDSWYEWKDGEHNNVLTDEQKLERKEKAMVNTLKELKNKRSSEYIMNLLVEGGLSTNDLMNMIDSLQIKAA